jgi:hypothetical protein
MNKLTIEQYVEKLKVAIASWSKDEVISAWVLTFEDDLGAQIEQRTYLRSTWQALQAAITPEYVQRNISNFSDDLCRAFFDYTQDNGFLMQSKALQELLPNLKKDIRLQCHKRLSELIAPWVLEAPSSQQRTLDIREYWVAKLQQLELDKVVLGNYTGPSLSIVLRRFAAVVRTTDAVNGKISELISLLLEENPAGTLRADLLKIPPEVRHAAAKALITNEEELEQIVEGYEVLYAYVELPKELRLELQGKLKNLQARVHSQFSDYLWDAEATSQSIRFLATILQLDENKMLSATTLTKLLTGKNKLYANYFDGMQALGSKVEQAVKREIIQRARSLQTCPEFRLQNPMVISSAKIGRSRRSSYVCSPSLEQRYSAVSSGASLYYYYDVFDNDYEKPANHKHSRHSARQQKQEYVRKVLSTGGYVRLSEMVTLRESLCCMEHKYGMRKPFWPIASETSAMANALEKELEEGLWEMSKQGPDHARLGRR